MSFLSFFFYLNLRNNDLLIIPSARSTIAGYYQFLEILLPRYKVRNISLFRSFSRIREERTGRKITLIYKN